MKTVFSHLATATLAALLCLAPVAAFAEAPLSQAQIEKLAEYLAKYGNDLDLDPVAVRALDLTRGTERLPVRQLTVKDPSSGLDKAYHHLKDGRFLFGVIGNYQYSAYLVSADQQLVKAVHVANNIAAPIADADARRALAAELTFWAGIAEKR